MKKKVLVLVFLMFGVVFAQQPSINIEHAGYGKTGQETYFTIHNTGETLISNISIRADGNLIRTIDAFLTPRSGIQITLYLDPGDHLIETTASEGAYDSLRITVSANSEKNFIPTPTPEQTVLLMEKNVMRIAIVVLILIFFLIGWTITRKPRL